MKKAKFTSTLFKGWQGSRGQSHLVASSEAKFPLHEGALQGVNKKTVRWNVF